MIQTVSWERNSKPGLYEFGVYGLAVLAVGQPERPGHLPLGLDSEKGW